MPSSTAEPGAHAGFFDGLPGSFWALLVGTFVNRAGSFVYPLLFIYLTRTRHVPIATAGSVVAVYGAGSLLGSFVGGLAADRFGRRSTMLAALVTSAGLMVLLAVSEALWQIAIVTFLLATAADAYRPACQALVADVVAPAHRIRAFALQYWVVNLGFAFAAVVGGFLADRSFTVLFVGDAITTLVLAAVIWRFVPESLVTGPRQGGEAVRAGGSFLTPFVDPRFAPFLLLNFAIVMIFFQHLTALPAHLRANGLGTDAFGLVTAANGVLIVVLQPTISRWLAGVPRARLLAAASLLTGAGFGLTTFATTLPGYVATVAVWTLGEIVFAPVNASIVAELSPAHLRGRYQGAFQLTWSTAMILSPALGPRLVAAVGFAPFWGLCFVVGLAVGVAHLAFTRRALEATPGTATGRV